MRSAVDRAGGLQRHFRRYGNAHSSSPDPPVRDTCRKHVARFRRHALRARADLIRAGLSFLRDKCAGAIQYAEPERVVLDARPFKNPTEFVALVDRCSSRLICCLRRSRKREGSTKSIQWRK
jgi:hypothetical protein